MSTLKNRSQEKFAGFGSLNLGSTNFCLDLIVTSADNDLANACDTFTGTGKSKAKIFANSELTAPVTTSSTELYFDGKICASSKVDNSNLIYEADLGTLFEPEDDIVTYRNMQWTKITCEYSSTVEGLGLKLIRFNPNCLIQN